MSTTGVPRPPTWSTGSGARSDSGGPSSLWTYACTTCGYVELHLLDPAGLAYVEQSWLPVPVRAE